VHQRLYPPRVIVPERRPRRHEIVLGQAKTLHAKTRSLWFAVPGPARAEVAAIGAVVVGCASHVSYRQMNNFEWRAFCIGTILCSLVST